MDWKCQIPMDFNALTQVKGPPERHIEQLWDEVKKLYQRIRELEHQIKKEKP